MARREPKVRDTRERVLTAALAEFAEKGLQAASIEDIAARAGLTKGAVYYYFTDKEDLAADLQAQLWKRMGDRASADLDPHAPALENVKRTMRSFLTALPDEAEARFFLRDCWGSPILDQPGRATHESGIALMHQQLAKAQQSGELAEGLDVDAAARLLLGVFAEATLHILTSGAVEPTMEVVERMVDALGAPERSRRSRRLVGSAR